MKNLARNNTVLLVCLVALIIFSPMFGQKKSLIASILLTATFFSGIFSLEFSPKSLRILLPLGTVTAATTWLGQLLNIAMVSLVDNLTSFLFLIAIVVLMVRHIARSHDVTPTIILSSINGYLLLGVLGSVLLAIADKLHYEFNTTGTSAIQFPGTATPEFSDFLYFSFVTLSTLGYGDITPVSHLSRSLTILIAVAGQMYMTILIAMLVGKYLSGYKR